jgi:hypothetical protein
MSYIKNKLDKFRKLTIQLRRKHFTIDTGGDGIVEVLPNLEEQARYNDGIEKFIEQALTDYHNHIVEKIHEYADSQDDETVAMAIRGTVSLINDLQDNPKE